MSRNIPVGPARLHTSRKMDEMELPKQSLLYRRRAAALARLAEAEVDETRMVSYIQKALSWIQLAENEELLADAEGDDRRSSH